MPLASPVVFEPVMGQGGAAGSFVARVGAGVVVLHAGGADLHVDGASFAMRFDDAVEALPQGEARLASSSHYIRGGAPVCELTTPHYGRVVQQGYPGVDVVYHSDRGRLEYDLVVSAGSDPAVIGMRFDGADGLRLDAGGGLLVTEGLATLVLWPPLARQHVAVGDSRQVDVGYEVSPDGVVTFALGPFDPGLPLVIDPVLELSTYLGGTAADELHDVATDDDGNVVAVGRSLSLDFPIASPLQGSSAGGWDAVIAKFDPTGSQLLFSTYVGGSGADAARRLVVAGGSIYVAGTTESADFPTMAPYQGGYGGLGDAFVVRLSASGDVLEYGTYLGGAVPDEPADLAIGHDGRIHVAGESRATNNVDDGWLTVLEEDGQSLVGTLLFPGFYDRDVDPYSGTRVRANGLAVDAQGTAYVGVNTTLWTTHGDTVKFEIVAVDVPSMTTAPVFVNDYGYPHSVITRLALAGGDLVWAGRRGDFVNPYATVESPYVQRITPTGSTVYEVLGPDSSRNSYAADMDVDPAGTVHVVGWLVAPDYQTVDPVQPSSGGGTDGFLFRVDPSGNVVHATFLGGSGDDRALGVAARGSSWIVGDTASVDFPLQDPIQPTHGGGTTDGFLARISPSNPGYVAAHGAGPGCPDRVRVFDASGSPTTTDFHAYGSLSWGVNVATAQVDAAADEIVTGPGPGPGLAPTVRGFRADGSAVPKVNLFAYGTLQFGVDVAGANVDGDGWDEILSGAGNGEVFGPHVRGWNVDAGTATTINGISFFAYGTPRHGVEVGAVDLEGDARGEILTGPGPGPTFAPLVRAFAFDGVRTSSVGRVHFWGLPTPQYGANVAGGDADGEPRGEIVAAAGPGPGLTAQVAGFDDDGTKVTALSGGAIVAFSTLYGARTGLAGIPGTVELLAGPGPDPSAGAVARSYAYRGGLLLSREITAFPAAAYGVNVQSGRLAS